MSAGTYFYFIFIFILLARRKVSEALNIRQAIVPTCIQRCQNTAIRLKFIFCLLSFIEIPMKFKTACQYCQSGESDIKYFSQGYNRIAQIGFELRSYHGALNHSITLLTKNINVELEPLKNFKNPLIFL